MNTSLLKALGAAILLHLLLMVAVQYLHPRTLSMPEGPPRPEIAPAAPIAIEILPLTLPAEFVETPSRNEAITPPRPARGRQRGARSMARPIQSDVAAATSPTVDDGPTPNGAPTLMSMRQSPTTIAPPRLDTRLALGARMPGTPRRELEQDRSDLIAPGVPRGRTDSPWQPSGGGSMRAVGEPYHAKIRSNGKIEFNDKPNIELEGLQLSKQYRIPVLAGHFDITDAVMSALGEQLYPYRKMRLMEESREMRAEMAFESNEHDLRHALTNYGQHLKWVWRQSEPSLLERRKALFLLWDECAEEGSTELLTSARSIRAMTLSFIRANLPQDSGDGYSALELQRLNQRRKSSVQFAPY